MVTLKPELRSRLIELRQSTKYRELRRDFRRTLRYVEGLEYEVITLRRALSNERNR